MAWDIASKTITENFTIAKVIHRIGAKLLYNHHSIIMVFYSQTQQHQVNSLY